jgi:hypothetical protein
MEDHRILYWGLKIRDQLGRDNLEPPARRIATPTRDTPRASALLPPAAPSYSIRAGSELKTRSFF